MHEHRSSEIHRMNNVSWFILFHSRGFPLLQTTELCMKYSKTNTTWIISGDYSQYELPSMLEVDKLVHSASPRELVCQLPIPWGANIN